MGEMKVTFGLNGSEKAWYISSGDEATFTPIDIALLPGPKPAFAAVAGQAMTSYTATSWDNAYLFNKYVIANTDAAGTDTFDHRVTWNRIKNVQVLSSTAQDVVIDGFVHVDMQVGTNDTAASHISLIGVKRANVITGGGDDTLDIQFVTDQNSVWVDDFRINTGAGNDIVKISGLDIAAKLAAGDTTYIEAINKPGLPLSNDGTGRNDYIATGAGNDTIIGYTGNDFVIAGTDTGTVEQVMTNAPPSGFGYAVGGSTKKGACDSILYKIDLATGASTAVGEVKIGLGWLGSVGGLDVESLSLNPKDGQLYGFASKLGILDAFVRIDPTSGKTTFLKLNLGNFHSELQDMAFDASGTLYFAVSGDFCKIDTVTGATKVIGNNTLNCNIGALAIDPLSDRVYGIGTVSNKAVMYEISKTTGKVVSTSAVTGLAACPDIEGMSFDSAGKLTAVDRETGQIYKIDVATHVATAVAKTLSDAQQYGDGFEALAIRLDADKVLSDLKAVGGDLITTAGGQDHIYYGAGDGVDRVTDFDLANDVLHISGYAANQLKIDVFGGDTFIRFLDSSRDGFVDNALIELSGVTTFDATKIVYSAAVFG